MTSSKLVQFKALLKKNWLLKKRKWKSTLSEILLPVIIMLLLVWIRSETDVVKNESKSYPVIQFDRTVGISTLLFQMNQFNEKLALIPDNNFTRNFASNLIPSSELIKYSRWNKSEDSVKIFKTETELEDYVTNYDYGNDVFPGMTLGIIFEKDGTTDAAWLNDNQWNIKLRFNSSTERRATFFNPKTNMTEFLPGFRRIPAESSSFDKLQIGYDPSASNAYLRYGFMTVQDLITNTIMRTKNSSFVPPSFSFKPFSTPYYVQDSFAALISNTIGLFFTLIFLWSVTRLVKSLVEEKELKIKEGMKMMGLEDTPLWTSWLVTYAIMFFLTALLITIVTSGSVYQHSNKLLVFIFFFLFGLSVFGFCYMISSLFSRARVASTTAALLFLAAFFPYYTVQSPDVSFASKSAACLSAPIAFSLGASSFAEWESSQIGANWSNLGEDYNNFQLGTALLWLFLDTVLYILLGLYFDKVVPQSYGVALPWNFFLKPSYWKGEVISDPIEADHNDDEKDDIELEEKEFLQDYKTESPCGVNIKNLKKVFGEGDKKTVAVKSLNLKIYEDEIFALLGHNGAGKTTTISMLTGMIPTTGGTAVINGMNILRNIPQIRKSMGVCPQHDILFDLMTVQEHLELYGAIKGIPKDKLPELITKIIQDVGMVEKINTKTSSLSGGQKRKLSVAIALIGDSKIILLDEPTSGMDPYSRRSTWNLIKKNKKGKVVILVTHFMDEADQLGDRIGIMAKGELKCCGTSLFLKNKYGVGYNMTVVKEEDADEDTTKKLIEYVGETLKNDSVTILSDAAGEIIFRLPFETSQSFPELFKCFDNEGQKDFKMASYGISVTTLEEVFLRVGHGEEKIKRQSSKQDVDIKIDDDQIKAVKTLDAMEKGERYCGRHFSALLWKRWDSQKRDKKVWIWQVVLPFIIVVVGIGLTTVSSSITVPGQDFNIEGQGYQLPQRVAVNSPYNGELGITGTTLLGLNASSNEELSASILANRKDFAETKYGGYFYNASANEWTVHFNTSAFHAVPVFYNLLVNSMYNSMLPGAQQDSDNIYLNFTHVALPLSASQVTLRNSLTAFMTTIGFAFIPAAFVGFIVFEKQSKAKHQQIVSGVNTYAYWFAAYLWDFMNYLVPAFLVLLVLLIFDVAELVGDNIGGTILSLLLFGASVAPFTYLASFAFDNHASAQNVMLLLFIFTGTILLIASTVLDIIPSTRDINNDLKYIYRIFPTYCFGESLVNIMIRDNILVYQYAREVFDFDIVGRPFVYMAVEAVVYFILVLVVEKVLATPDLLLKCKKKCGAGDVEVEDQKVEKDIDIQAEENKINNGDADEAMIRLEGIRKVYPGRYGAPPKAAVKDLWFSVEEGECFGFLGINGAGKTTSLKILTGDVLPSKGVAYLNGYNILTQQSELRKHIGYVPQFDSILPLMTGRETLRMYARIKGVEETKVETYVNEMISMLKIEIYADKPCGGYSGGNKRKLSVGMALIGSPSIVFLDEPSTGMDPQSRRFLWSLISSTMKGRSVILTTHSMEECEALCNRVGIMVSGRLKCCGSAQHLRERYGKGYQIDVNCEEKSVEKVQKYIENEFEGTLVEKQGTLIKYRVPKDAKPLGELFSDIEKNKEEMGIQEYAIAQTSLEQIFLSFASSQEEEVAIDYK